MEFFRGLFYALIITLVVLFLVGGCVAYFKAPCSTFKYSAGKDIPGRCLMKHD